MDPPDIKPQWMVFLFTDLVDSTGMKGRLRDDGYARFVMQPHDAMFRELLARYNGTERDRAGDGFFATFDSLGDAIRAALLFQHQMQTRDWEREVPSTRLGIHVGEARVFYDPGSNTMKTVGQDQDIAARIMSLGSGCQILLTKEAFERGQRDIKQHPANESASDSGPTSSALELTWARHGRYVIKGAEHPMDVCEVGAVGFAPLQAPEDSVKAWHDDGPEAERLAIAELDGGLAELQSWQGAGRSQLIDAVFKAALEKAEPFLARRLEACNRIYTRAAAGISQVLRSGSDAELLDGPAEIKELDNPLQEGLSMRADTPESLQRRVDVMRRVMLDFVHRAPASKTIVRRATWIWTLSLVALSFASLYWAYHYSDTTPHVTWELKYARPYDKSVRVGPWLEVARSAVLLAMTVYLLELTLRDEYQLLFLDWRRSSWRRPFVTLFRVLWLTMFVVMTKYTCYYIAFLAPTRLSIVAKDLYKEMVEEKDGYLLVRDTDSRGQSGYRSYFEGSNNKNLKAWKNETEDAFTGHVGAYLRYGPYCWVNYIGFALSMLAVTSFSVARDARMLIQEREVLYEGLRNPKLSDSNVDEAFGGFFDICIRHTHRYTTVLAWLAGAVCFELLVSAPTLAPAGLFIEFLCTAVVGTCTVVWIGLLLHFFEGAFQRACAEKRRRRNLSEEWESRSGTLRLLRKSFLSPGGAFFLTLLVADFFLSGRFAVVSR